MVSVPARQLQDCQRIQVEKEIEGSTKTLKISVERYDEKLGWYSAGALSFPIHQLPLLQQALDELSVVDRAGHTDSGKIVPFPLLEILK